MKTAVVYARYSSDNQTEQSIEGQLRVCREYAQRNNIVILDTYIDRAMTGTNDNRPDFQRMLRDSAGRRWDYVLVYKLDRFSRNKYETAIHKKTLHDNGVKVLSAMENIPDTPEGIILESLLEGMNQYYSAELSQKIKRGMRETRLKGHFQGGCPPYGYKIDGQKIVIDEEAAENVRYIFTEYSKGVHVSKILDVLEERGQLCWGKPFRKYAVYNILRREKYTGVYRYGEDNITDMYPQIIPEELYKKVRSILEKNKNGKRSVKVNYLLRHKIICGYCGQPVVADSSNGRNNTRYYYKCRGRKDLLNDCQKASMRKEKLEQLVIDAVVERLKDPLVMSELIRGIMDAQKKQYKERSALKSLIKEQRQNESALKNIVSAIERGIINNTTQKRMNELEKRQEELERLILIEKNKQTVLLTEAQIREYYEEALRSEPQLLINYLIQKIVWYDDRIEIFFTNPIPSPIYTGPDTDRGFLFCKVFL